MAAKNWRENTSGSSNPPKAKKLVRQSAPNEPMRLGPLVKGLAFTLTLVALAFAGKWGLDLIQPMKTTVLVLLNEVDAEFNPDVQSSGLYSTESVTHVGANNDHLARVYEFPKGPVSELGPNKDTALFFISADLLIDSNNEIKLSRNGSAESQLQEPAWTNLSGWLDRICKAELKSDNGSVNRVLMLDIGEVDKSAMLNRDRASVGEAIRALLQKMKADKTNNIDRLWVIVSAGDQQKSWYAPELGSSVFTFFVSRGLDGFASAQDDQIALRDLFQYVEKSVSKWTSDNRNSMQSPQILTESPIDLKDVSVVWDRGRDADAPVINLPEYRRAELGPLWATFSSRKSKLDFMPNYLSMIESRLLRLEVARYGADSDSARSQKIFKKLKSEIEVLFDRHSLSETKTNDRLISIEQLTNPQTPAARLQEFLAFLYPVPIDNATPDGGAPKTAEGTQATPPPAPVELSESLQQYNRTQWLQLVWEYLSSDRVEQDAFALAHFDSCIKLIESAPAATDDQVASVNGKPITWVELQYLKLLRDNVDWFPAGTAEFLRQRSALLRAIQCRHKSESLIQGSAVESQTDSTSYAKRQSQLARNWPLVRAEFANLELERRQAEDLLFANQIEDSLESLNDLNTKYDSLVTKTNQLIRARDLMHESLHIIPHLRDFLIHEAIHQETNEAIEIFLARLNSAQRTAYSIAEAFRQGVPDFATTQSDSSTLEDDMDWFEQQISSTYINRLVQPEKSTGDVVFLGINLLSTPIPEWLSPSKREVVRENLDKWIKEQHEDFRQAWDEFQASDSKATKKATLTKAKLHDILAEIPKPKHDSLLEVLNSDSLISIGQSLQLLKPGGSMLDEHFDEKRTPIAKMDALIQWQAKFENLDFEIRDRAEIFSKLDKSLDLGELLASFDQVLLSNDKLDRIRSDCWGSGVAHEIRNAGGSPPFVIFGTAQHAELQKRLAELADFDSKFDPERKAFSVESLANVFNAKLSQINANWDKLGSATIAWNGTQPTGFDSSLTVTTKLESKLTPVDFGIADPMTMSTSLFLNENRIHRTAPFEFDTDSMTLPLRPLKSSQLQAGGEFEQIVGFRGNQIKGEFTLTRNKIIAPKISKFTTTHTNVPLGAPSVEVINQGLEGDIIFVLDCSASMKDRVNGKRTESGAVEAQDRFYFAKEALRQTIKELKTEQRFRFGFYAFGHRSSFIKVGAKKDELKRNKDGMYLYSGVKGVHPFDDCEGLVSLGGKLANIDTQINDCKAQGCTPLYYSIKKAVEEEFAGQDSTRKRFLIVLTDGNNNQFDTKLAENYHRAVPPNKRVEDATTVDQVRQMLTERGAELLVARISDSGKTTEDEIRALEQAGAKRENILSINDDNSQTIANRILDAIGRSQFAVTPQGGKSQSWTKIPNKVNPTKKSGNFVVETKEVRQSDKFEIELHQGVSVTLENMPDGLRLSEALVPEFLKTPQPIQCNLASGQYMVGRVSATTDNTLAFAFRKTTKLVGSDSDNFSFRPQRIWAQLIDRKTGDRVNLFLPNYKAGQYPIAVFKLPSSVQSLTDVDVRLWIAPNINDRGKPIEPYKNTIGLGQSDNNGISCLLARDEKLGTSSISAKRAVDDPRDFFIGCPQFLECLQTTLIEDGQLTETFAYSVPNESASFTLSILPLDEYTSIMKRVKESKQSFGVDRDPIFGDTKSAWIDFKQIKIRN